MSARRGAWKRATRPKPTTRTARRPKATSPDCGSTARCRLKSDRLQSASRCPWNETCPVVGFHSRDMSLSKVDLPAPLGRRMAMRSPGVMCTENGPKECAPKRMPTESSCSNAVCLDVFIRIASPDPAPCAAQQQQEERAAQQGRKNSDRNFCGDGDRAGQGIGHEQEQSAHQHGQRYDLPLVCTDPNAHEVGRNQSDEADH